MHQRLGGKNRSQVLRWLVVATLIAVTSVVFSPSLNGPANASTAVSGGLFVPLQQRIYDSRTTSYSGNTGNQLVAGKWYPVAVAGVGVAPKSGIRAVQVTLTEVNAADGRGTLKADATGVADPNTTVPALIWADGKESNSATIPVGADGKFQIFVTSVTDIVIDVQGYYTTGATAAGGYVPGGNQTILAATSKVYSKGDSLDIQVAGGAAVPSGAAAAMVSILVTPTDSTAGNLQVYPNGTPPSTPWLLNWSSNETTVVSSAVALPTSGKITIGIANGSVKLQVAIQGYFTPSAAAVTAGTFYTQRARIIDTRSDTPLAPGETRTFQVTGKGGIPDDGTPVAAVAGNIVVYPGTSSSATGSIALSSDDETDDFVAQYFYPGEDVSAFAITTLGADGGINVHNKSNGTIDVVLDAEGWYRGYDKASVSCPNGIQDGTWFQSALTQSTTCQITAPAAPSGNGVVNVSINGGPAESITLSTTALTTYPVTLDPGAGSRTIWTNVDSGLAGPFQESLFTFGSGDWTDSTLSPLLVDGSNSDDLTPGLWTESTPVPLGADASERVTISATPDLQNPIFTSPWSDDVVVIADGLLTEGEKYYWRTEILAGSNFSGTSESKVSPIYSFVATKDPFLADDDSTSSATTGTATGDTTSATSSPEALPSSVGGGSCAKIYFLGARGTFAPAGDPYNSKKPNDGPVYKPSNKGFGLTLSLLNALKRDGSLGVSGLAINYPAAGNINGSAYTGAMKMIAEMNALAKLCPSAKVWLAGHSQGAVVVAKVADNWDDLTKGAKAKFRGAVLTGDPSYQNKETPVNAAGNGTKNGKGLGHHYLYNMQSHKIGTPANPTNKTVLFKSFCYSNDKYCQSTGTSGDVHSSYGKAATVNRETPFLKQFIG